VIPQRRQRRPSSLQVPQLDLPVTTSTRQQPLVPRLHARDPALVARQAVDLRRAAPAPAGRARGAAGEGTEVEDVDALVIRGGDEEQRGEGERADRGRVSREGGEEIVGLAVEEGQVPSVGRDREEAAVGALQIRWPAERVSWQ